MKKLKYILIIFCFTLHYSCDSFLDVRPEGEVVNNELFKNAEGFEDAIYGVYSTLAGPSYYGRTMTYYFNDILSQYFFYDYPGDVTLKITLSIKMQLFVRRSIRFGVVCIRTFPMSIIFWKIWKDVMKVLYRCTMCIKRNVWL